MTETVFLDPHTRELYADWPRKARAAADNLRLVAGAHPDDPALASLVGRLVMNSPEFDTMWSDQRVRACATAQYDLHHPLVGDLTVTQQTLRSVDQPDQTLITSTAPDDSASAQALHILGQLTHSREEQVRPAVGESGGVASPARSPRTQPSAKLSVR